MLEHFIILRQRLLFTLISFTFFFLLFWVNAKPLVAFILSPLLKTTTMITTSLTAPLFVPIHVAFLCAIIATLPIFYYQLYQFILPGLLKHERRRCRQLLIGSLLLGFIGLTLSHLGLMPFGLKWLLQSSIEDIQTMPELTKSLNLILHIDFMFILLFQLPIILFLFLRPYIKQIRPFFIVFAFTFGMIITPPDVLSQCLVAIPMILLFELTALILRIRD